MMNIDFKIEPNAAVPPGRVARGKAGGRRMDSFTSRVCAYVCHISPLVLLRCEQHNWMQAFIQPGRPGQCGSQMANIRQALRVMRNHHAVHWLLKSRLGSHPARQVVTASILLGKFSP
jgi:hypothetical protein